MSSDVVLHRQEQGKCGLGFSGVPPCNRLSSVTTIAVISSTAGIKHGLRLNIFLSNIWWPLSQDKIG